MNEQEPEASPFPDVEGSLALASFLRDHAPEIARSVVNSFRNLISAMGATALSDDQNLDWALEGVYSMAEQLENGRIDAAQYESFSVGGDSMSEPFVPLEYYVKSRLHIASVVAPLVWNEFTFERATMERLLNCLETYTQASIAANTETFLAELSQPKAVRRHWNLGRPATGGDRRPSAIPDDPLFWLTARERQIVDLVAQGRSNNEIAGSLGIRVNTVKGHMQHIFDKLGVASRTEVALVALKRR